MLPLTAPNIIQTIKSTSPEFVVVEVVDVGVKVTEDHDEKVWFIGQANEEDAKQLVEMFREERIAARLKTTKLVHCPFCEHYHPSDTDEDCRDDIYRFPKPSDLNDEGDYFDDGSPGLGVHAPRKTYRNGQELHRSNGGCDDCEVVMINGLFCHENGCPSAWKDRKVDCFQCGYEFYPEQRGQRLCEDCLNPPEVDEEEPEEENDDA